jgi:uncharacterized heparinase superfamily protein
MSILSHNSVRVDYDNPALIGGPTMWLDHYKSRVLDYSSGKNSDFVAATHNGYKKKGVQHKRRINFDKTTGYIKITDRFEVLDKKKHDLEIPFHTHPQIIIEEKEPHHFHLSHKNTQDIDLSLQLDKKVASSIKKGWLSPITGWYSKSFQQKEEASVIFCTLSIEDTTEILTLIKVKEQP